MTPRHSHRQRGSVIISAAIFMSAAIVLLLGIEIGYLYYIKRDFQKTADLAALAGAQRAAGDATSAGCTTAHDAAVANATANLATGLMAVSTANIAATPGKWTSTGGFMAATANCDAVHVVISKTPNLLLLGIAGNAQRNISAQATATLATTKAALSIRSTLLTVDSSTSALLNPVFGGLLGGTVNLTAVGWDGLVQTNVNLLGFMDALAVQLHVTAGDYDTLLKTNATIGQLLQAAITGLNQGGSAVGVAASALTDLITASATVSSVNMTLGQLLDVQSGTPASGLDTNIQAFQLAQAIVQLANANNKSAAYASINALGLSVKVKVIEPAQVSAVGNPALAKLDPLGANKIYVRTAQVRTLLSVDLPSPLTSLVSGLTTAVLNLAAPVTDLLNNVLSLNLVGTLSSLSCLVVCDKQSPYTDIVVLPSPFRFDVNLDAASGNAHVADFDCSASGNKSLTVPTQTAATTLRIGKMGSSASDAATKVFSSSTPPIVQPVPLIDIGTLTVRYQCTLLLFCTTSWKKGTGWVSDKTQADRVAFSGGGVGLMTDAPIASSTGTLTFTAPPTTSLPDLGATATPTPYQPISSSNIVSSLSTTLSGVGIQMYKPTAAGSGLGELLYGVGTVLNGVTGLLQQAVSTVLSPLLDPLVNLLLKSLGIDLAKTEVGARMTCRADAQLVY